MKTVRKISALLIALAVIISCSALTASAASSDSGLSLTIETDRDSCGEMGIINVTVTVKNNTSVNIPNLVVSSEFSQGLVLYKPVKNNVIITTPNGLLPTVQRKSDSMTTCLKPGATLKYTYCVLLSCAMARRNISEFNYNLMVKQHRLLNTKNFRTLDIDNGYVETDYKILTFGDVKTALAVAAFFGMDNATYDAIASGQEVEEKPAETKTTSEETSDSSRTGIRTSFKEFWDEFEKFYATYTYYIKHSDEFSPEDKIKILGLWSTYMQKMSAYEQSDDLSPEEIAYMYAVIGRTMGRISTL